VSTANDGGDAAGVAAAKAYIAPFLTKPTTIGITIPLIGKPAGGKTVFLISVNDPSTTPVDTGFTAGAAALGWSGKVLLYTDPTQGNSLITQALQQGASYIAILGLSASETQSGLAAAKAKGVPVFQVDSTSRAKGPANWLFSQVDDLGVWAERGKINADYVIANSNGHANVLAVGLPSFASQLNWEDGLKSEFSKNCPTCTLKTLDVPYTTLESGATAGEVLGYLRAHPEVNNVVFGVGSEDDGLLTAASSAGIKIGGSGVQVSLQDPNQGDLQDIINGSYVAAVATPNAYDGWLVIDAMARQSLKMDLEPNWNSTTPLFMQTKTNISSTNLYEGPTGYQAEFKKLWNVS
jgi:ABC-type sugar transport system substrate-binding protein